MSLRDFGFSATGFVPSQNETVIFDDKIYCNACAEELDIEGEASEFSASQCVNCQQDETLDLELDNENLEADPEDLDSVVSTLAKKAKVKIELDEEQEDFSEEEEKEAKREKRRSKMLDNVIESLHGSREEKPKKVIKAPQKEIKQCQAVPLVARVKINGVWTEQPVRI